MGHGHVHTTPDDPDALLGERVRRSVWIAVGACVAIVVLGLVTLWPTGDTDVVDPSGVVADTVDAEVVDSEQIACAFDPSSLCAQLEIVVQDGQRAGETFVLDQGAEGTIEVGDRIEVFLDDAGDGTTIVTFFDFDRSTPMLILVALFVVVIIAFARWKGLGALAGLVASLMVIVWFTVPALLDGTNAVMIAVVTSGVIATVALLLAHGFHVATAVALLSTLASLGLTGVLAVVFVWTSNLTGLSDESAGFLDVLGTQIDPRGLLLAGILVGSLGVLDDVTVTQVSTVWELKRAAPRAGLRELYERGVRVGRDHISSTVNTLFLAYAGASLPLLLLFSEAGQSLTSVATREVVAVEIVRALVGSIGLIASVPISTALAAAVVTAESD